MPKMDVSRIMAFKLWRSSPDGLASNTDQAMAMRLRDLKTIKHQIKTTIIGYEVLQQRDMYVVFKIRVEDKRPWSIDSLPVWHIFRRYSDFFDLFRALKTSFPLSKLDIPPRRWLGNRFDSVFIGKRISRLQEFMSQIFEEEEDLRDSALVRDFFCIDNPPTLRTESFDRTLYDCFEEVIRELREQLRTREVLEMTNQNQREALQERDLELDGLRVEVETLRKQKEGLLKALSEENPDSLNSLTLQVPQLKAGSHYGSRLSLASSSMMASKS